MIFRGAKKLSWMAEHWARHPLERPTALRAGAVGKGREGDKSPSQGLERKGFMNLSDGYLHALRHKASSDSQK